jgi:hypothetical protein
MREKNFEQTVMGMSWVNLAKRLRYRLYEEYSPLGSIVP